MKKKLTLVLALCACFAFSAAFAACEKEEAAPSSSPQASSPADSTPETPETPALPLTKAQWEALFALENVTVTVNMVYEGQNIPIQKLLLVGDKCGIEYDGMITSEEGAAEYRKMFDVSDCYDKVEYKGGKFYLASHYPFGDGDMYYENLYITVQDGKMVSVEANMVEVADDGTKTSDPAYIEFTNYGTTVIPEKNLPITEEQWRAAFDANRFNNITTTVEFTLDGIGDVTETIYYANGVEKIVVEFPEAEMNGVVDLYSVDGQWYVYYIAEDNAVPIESVADVDYTQYTTISSMLKSFVAQGAEMYIIMQYDELTDEYYYAADGTELRFTITEGVLTGYSISITTGASPIEQDYTFSNWGMTAFEVPFNVPEKTE